MHPQYFALTLALLLQATASWAGATVASETTDYQPIAARYEETRSITDVPDESSVWYFIRQPNQVEILRADYAEIWQRDERGELSFTRVFHADRTLIQYTPGQLRTEGLQKNWSVLNTIIDPRRLLALEQVGTVTFLDRPALRYEGQLGDQRIEIIWLIEENLVARFVHSTRDATVLLELKDLRSSPDSTWPQAGLATVDAYTALDAADLGDMEYDPFVKRVLAGDSAQGSHEHYAH